MRSLLLHLEGVQKTCDGIPPEGIVERGNACALS